MDKKTVLVDKDVFEALNTLKYKLKNPYKLLCYKIVNNEDFSSDDLAALNKIEKEDVLKLLDFGYELKQPVVEENEILQNVSSILIEQTKKGYAKYGKTVQASDLTTEQWIDHASEEIIDTLVYLQCIKERLKNES